MIKKIFGLFSFLFIIFIISVNSVYAFPINKSTYINSGEDNLLEVYLNNNWSDLYNNVNGVYSSRNFISGSSSNLNLNYNSKGVDGSGLPYNININGNVGGGDDQSGIWASIGRARYIPANQYKLVIKHITGTISGDSRIRAGFGSVSYGLYDLPTNNETVSYIINNEVLSAAFGLYYDYDIAVGYGLSSNYSFQAMLVPISYNSTIMLDPIYYNEIDNTVTVNDSVTYTTIMFNQGDDINADGIVKGYKLVDIGDYYESKVFDLDSLFYNGDGYTLELLYANPKLKSYGFGKVANGDSNFINKWWYGDVKNGYFKLIFNSGVLTLHYNLSDDINTIRESIISSDSITLTFSIKASNLFNNNLTGDNNGTIISDENADDPFNVPTDPAETIYKVFYYNNEIYNDDSNFAILENKDGIDFNLNNSNGFNNAVDLNLDPNIFKVRTFNANPLDYTGSDLPIKVEDDLIKLYSYQAGLGGIGMIGNVMTIEIDPDYIITSFKIDGVYIGPAVEFEIGRNNAGFTLGNNGVKPNNPYNRIRKYNNDVVNFPNYNIEVNDGIESNYIYLINNNLGNIGSATISFEKIVIEYKRVVPDVDFLNLIEVIEFTGGLVPQPTDPNMFPNYIGDKVFDGWTVAKGVLKGTNFSYTKPLSVYLTNENEIHLIARYRDNGGIVPPPINPVPDGLTPDNVLIALLDLLGFNNKAGYLWAFFLLILAVIIFTVIKGFDIIVPIVTIIVLLIIFMFFGLLPIHIALLIGGIVAAVLYLKLKGGAF